MVLKSDSCFLILSLWFVARELDEIGPNSVRLWMVVSSGGMLREFKDCIIGVIAIVDAIDEFGRNSSMLPTLCNARIIILMYMADCMSKASF